jgi:anaerobic selenocysteine-containing dehydrogenase
VIAALLEHRRDCPKRNGMSMPIHDATATAPAGSREVRHTTCYMCACRCGIRVHLQDGKLRHIDGTPVHSFSTLMTELATIVRNTCRTPNAGPDAPTFEILTTPSAKQHQAFALLQQIRV